MNTRTVNPTHDHKTGEAQGAPYFELCAPNTTSTYTGFGTFSSIEAAGDAWRSSPRSGSGVAMIRECRDAIRFEVVYGIFTAIVETAIAPTWH